MDLHGIVRGAVTAVNPDITVAVSQSTGYTTADDGTQVPTYSTFPAEAQVQALSGKDLRQIDGLNLQGTLCAIYFFGQVSGNIRASSEGGDLVTVPSGPYAGTWLVTNSLETWPDWSKCVCTLQNGA